MDASTIFFGAITFTVGILTLIELSTSAVSELVLVLLDALEAADLQRRLAAWWYCCVSHRHLVDGPPPQVARPVTFNERQLTALRLARVFGRVTNGDLQAIFWYHPETLRQDLAALVELGYLDKRGRSRGTFYTPGGGNALDN